MTSYIRIGADQLTDWLTKGSSNTPNFVSGEIGIKNINVYQRKGSKVDISQVMLINLI